MILLRKTKLLECARVNLVDSVGVGKRQILAVSDGGLADGNTLGKLAALMRMGNLDEAHENVCLPGFIHRVVEDPDVPVEKQELSPETSRVPLQPLYLLLNGIVGSVHGTTFDFEVVLCQMDVSIYDERVTKGVFL